MYKLLFLTLSCALIIACNTTTTDNDTTNNDTDLQSQLNGNWNLVKASRGNNNVDLPGVYITFTEDATLESNIQTSPTDKPFETAVAYEIGDNQINVTGTDHYFDIKSINDTSLVLKTELMNFDFTFEFLKEMDGSSTNEIQ